MHPPSGKNRAVLLLGPTGAGKTPLGRLIEQRGLWREKCLHFDFGDTLRQLVARNQPDELIGPKDIELLRRVLESGALLEEKHFPIAGRILQSCMAAGGADRNTWIILNGLPRHVGQARAIDAFLDVRVVVRLECSSETVFERIGANVGGDRTERTDDDLGAVGKRLAIFNRRTSALLEHYRRRGATIEVVKVTAAMMPQQMWELLDRRR